MALSFATSATAADDYPADCSPVSGENCRTAPLDAYVDHWGFYSRECTSFVAWRLSRRGPFHNSMRGGHFGNATTWGTNAQNIGFPVDDNPVPGAVAWTASGLGHVAIVEAVHANGTVTIEEYNVPAYSGNYSRRTVARGAYRYIHIYDGGGTPTEGSFIRAPDGRVYRVAGGAPIYVSSWAPFGGGQPVIDVSYDQLNAMRPWPADGTFVNSAQDGAVYRIAGGAPIYVSTWNTYGGPQPTISIDKWAIDNTADPAAHLRAVPADGTFLSSAQDGAVYRIAGGAPIYVSTWNTYGGPQPTVAVDKWAVDNVTHPAAHLRAVPADGTFVNTAQDGAVYRIAGGAPIYVSTWSTYGAPQPSVTIDKWAVDHSTNAAAHLRALPADGTFIRAAQNGAVYRIAGGAAIYVSTWSIYGGAQPHVTVDRWALENPGHPAAHLRSAPLDDTRVRGLPSGAYWSFTGGRRSAAAAIAGAITVDDVGLNAFALAETAVPASAAMSTSSSGTEPPSQDRTAPRATLTVSGAQRRGRTILARVACPDEACRATVHGSIRVPADGRTAAKRYAIRAVSRSLAAGKAASVRLTIGPTARRAIDRALVRRRKVTVIMTAQLADSSGNTVTLTRNVRLTK